MVDCLPPPQFTDPEPGMGEIPVPVSPSPVEPTPIPIELSPVEPIPPLDESVDTATTSGWLCQPCREAMRPPRRIRAHRRRTLRRSPTVAFNRRDPVSENRGAQATAMAQVDTLRRPVTPSPVYGTVRRWDTRESLL